MTYRMLGQRDTMLSYMYSGKLFVQLPINQIDLGVSQETALLSCHLNPKYQAEPDPDRPKIFERHIWYPYSEGLLRSHLGIDENSPISSELTVNLRHFFVNRLLSSTGSSNRELSCVNPRLLPISLFIFVSEMRIRKEC